MHIRRTFTAAAIAALTLTGVGATAGTAAAAPPTTDTYIVMLDPHTVPAEIAARAARLGGRIEHVYGAVGGFAINLQPTLAARLSTLPGVRLVERNQVMQTQVSTTQSGATWGLDRIDQRTAVKSTGSFIYTNTGAGVTAYIIDTGIQFANGDFGARAKLGVDELGGNGSDCNGHGTHVAGTVGGQQYGVAKQVTLVAVRVLDCSGSGTTAGVIDGVNWVTENHQIGQPAVANMSLGGGASAALDSAVTASIADGVTYAVAAGNGNAFGTPQNACNSSPARVPTALTVGATDRTDAAASFSNYGSCVDLFAPGVSITSDWYNAPSNTISGTSMATPHVTGVAALYLQTHPSDAPATVSKAITDATTKGVVRTSSRYRTANNNLLFTSY